ncbi:MAG: helix-turn-helix domain-containing protein [Cyclobacteriaceae bacterium]|nr:helix-turn-helix domain-containing protein [Cyclobacteriaceae bacterium]
MAKIASKRVVAFNVPQTTPEIVRVQVDEVPYFYDQLHQHPEIQIMWIERGQGTLVAGDFVGRFQPGEVYVIGGGQPHVFRCDPEYYRGRQLVRSISLYFSEKYFGQELWNAEDLRAVRELSEASRRGLMVPAEAATPHAACIGKIASTTGLARLVAFFELLHLLTITQELRKLSLAPGRLLENEEGRMNKILGFTFRESRRRIYLEEVARLANLSVEAFCRYFKVHTRKTYVSFLNEVRVSHACRLLIQGNLSVEQICYETGFNNVSNFNRIFKRVIGKTPLAYRAQAVGQNLDARI